MNTRLIRSMAVLLCITLAPSAIAKELTLWEIAANRHAKILCSGIFLSGRTAEDILTNDNGVPDPSTLNFIVDTDTKKVTILLQDGFKAVSVFREGCGCTNLYDVPEEDVRNQPIGDIPLYDTLSDEQPWPLGEGDSPITAKISRRKMQKAIDYAFDEPSDDMRRGTRAIVVVHQGKIVAEHYANGYSRHQPLIIWSMGKSIISTLTAILVKQDKLDIHAPAPVPEWSDANDPRHAITTDQLLRMSSGLEFVEEYSGALVDVVIMLYGQPDTAGFTASHPLEADPDSKWYYSSGTTNVISRIIKQSLDNDLATYAAFPNIELFNKIGMHNTTMEMDAAGTFIGSSFTHSSARDMARFGLFTMQDGVWNGERILPEGWMNYARTPTAHVPKNEYGAQFWLNHGDEDDKKNRRWPSLPHDAFGLSGFQGQSVVSIASRDTVIVRLGLSSSQDAWSQDEFMRLVLKALPKS
ncbi:MAG: serine hydrolase [Candidatus Hydrogenedentota bacterium]